MKRKFILISFILVICLFAFMPLANASEMFATSLTKEYIICRDPNVLKALRIIAYVLSILKILTPIVLIVTGMNSFVKATLSSDDKALKEAGNLLIKKILTGAVIFFIPTAIYAGFEVVSTYDKTKAKFTECGKCITSIKECNTLIKRYK